MSEDARSTKGRKVLYVANPGSGGSDDGSEDYHRRPNGHSYPYKRPHQQVYLASRQPRLTPSQPPILTTDLPLKNSNYQQPQPQLSPDSTGSPAADESTPPPTTPSLHAPSASVDLQPRADNFNKPLPIPDATTSSHCDRASPNETTPRSITSRKGKFLQTLKAPFGSRPPPRTAVDNNSPRRPRTSPTAPTPDPITSPSSATPVSTASEVKKIMATVDSERYVTVEFNSTWTAAQIRELILSRLNIYNDDEQNPFSIYQTEIGSYAIGDALTNDALLAVCLDQGDSKGTLKFFVSHASASVHEPPPPPSMEYTMPPPVLPHMVNINPLRLKRRSRSRNGSFSSTSENLPPEVAAGYEADLDYPDREINKSSPKHLIAPPMATSSANQLSPRRLPSNQNRPSSPLIQNPEPASSPPNSSERTWSQRKEDKHPHALPAIPIPQPPQPPSLSPNRPSFTSHDELPPILPNPKLHSRTGSDADVVSTLKAAENTDNSAKPLRRPGPDNSSYGKSRLESFNVNDLLPSRRPQDDEDASWEIVPSNLVQRPTDDLERVSPISRHTARQPGISRFRPSSPYTNRHQANRHIMNHPPTRAPPATPSGPQEIRTATQTRPARLPVPKNVFVTWKGEEGGNRKASPASVPTNGSRLGKNVTKSMDNLKLSFSPTSRRNPILPITRPPGTVRDLSYSPNTVTYSGIPKSYEPPRPNFVRPLPAQGSSHTTSPDVAQGSSMPYAFRSNTTNLTSPSQDPFPRPQSATGDPLISPSRSHIRLQSPFYGSTLDSGEANLSPRAVSPHRGYHSSGIPGPRPRPRPTHNSDRSDRSSDIQSGPETTNSTPPRTPISPQSPRYDGSEQLPLSSLSSSISASGNRSSETTLKQGDHVHFTNLLDHFDQMDDKTHVVPRALPQPRQLTPPPPPEAPNVRNSFGLDYEEEDDESDDGGGTWIRRPDPPKTLRPPLKVQIDSSAVSQRSADAITSQDTPPASLLPGSTVVPKQLPKASARPGSTFIDADSGSWAPRPPPENIYDHLDQFFSKHDLDKPVIEAISGDTSPTTAEPAIPPPPNPVNDNKARIRAKKSIRIVAEEHKKRINRTSVADPAALASNVLRKRHTKLWGSKLEELTTFRSSSTISLPESPSSGPSKATFKWVRGELIGQGTYGRVYLALNATTGEMIAVKQVELPRTASDKNDSRQHAVVQALKMESETLKDLDHPHIVQYLGFEETPSNLSIFLEYVPGGSVGSCLHRHGKFDDNVTRSFTAQILSGLEYLHSRGILHRDLKADNILVEMSGTCKISDFGISKRTEDVHGGAFTAMQGTVFWMAPEVVHTKKSGYNFKIDIWSVGCVVLEMWAGMRPWMGEETVAVMFKLFQSKLPPPVPDDVVLGEDADDFRRKCFAINPEERPSAAELRKHPYLLLPSDWEFTGFT